MHQKIRSFPFNLFLSSLVILLIPGTLLIPSSAGYANASSDFILRTRTSDANGLVLELNLPALQFESGQSDAGACQRIHLDGWGELGNPGQPALPFKGEMIGLPPLGTAQTGVVEIGPETTVENVILCPVATQVHASNPDAIFQEPQESYIIDTTAFQASNERPGNWAELGAVTYLRSQRVAQLRIQPFQYQASTHRLRYTTHLVIRVQFDIQSNSTDRWINEGPYESILKNTLINYSVARSWRVAQTQAASERSLAANPDSAVQIAVSSDGIYRVTQADLLAHNVPVGNAGLDPRTFRLLNNGVETAILVQGESDGTFDAGDELLFYGQKNTSRYTNTNIYWLTWGGANGLRVANRDGTPGTSPLQTSFLSTVRAEKNQTYRSNYPSGNDDDRWDWELITASSTTISKEYTIVLPHVSTNVVPGTTAVVRGLLRGYAAFPVHHTRIYFNNVPIVDTTWAAQGELAFEATIPHTNLLEGNNTIKVECVLDNGITLDYTLVNWFEVDYQRDYAADSGIASFNGDQAGSWIYQIPGFSGSTAEVWDITNPLEPQRIIHSIYQATSSGYTLVIQQENTTARHYLAVEPGSLLTPDSFTAVQLAGLHSTTNGADYIIISHPDFLDAIQPLADHYIQSGMRVRVINVQDIYNEFGNGTLDPTAIRNFLAYTYNSWTRPAPSYVLLVGDGNYDFKNYKGYNEPNYIPPYLADVDPWMGEVPADNLYVAFNSTNDLPDMALGRLPVKTAAEATTVIQKILNYPQNSTGTWNKNILSVADIPDTAGDFAADADAFNARIPVKYTVDKVYLPTGANSTTVASARQSILKAMNAGRLIIHYSGHSSSWDWSMKTIFTRSSIPSLTNLNSLPFVLSMTCYVGYYVEPSPTGSDYSSLDEMLVRASNGGAIATWSPTGEGSSAGHNVLDAGFTQALFDQHTTRMGLATDQAKYYLYTNSTAYRELIDTYLLMGDPALKLPVDSQVYLPFTQR